MFANSGRSREQKALAQDSKVSGFSRGIYDGMDAGQTVMHCHFHLIPRRKGDIASPKGGIRRIIPCTGDY